MQLITAEQTKYNCFSALFKERLNFSYFHGFIPELFNENNFGNELMSLGQTDPSHVADP